MKLYIGRPTRGSGAREIRDDAGGRWASLEFDRPPQKPTTFRFANGIEWQAIVRSGFRQFTVEGPTGSMGSILYRRGSSLLRAQIQWEIIDLAGTPVALLQQTRVFGIPGQLYRALRGRPLMEYVGAADGEIVGRATQKFRASIEIDIVERGGADTRLLVTGFVLAMLLDAGP